MKKVMKLFTVSYADLHLEIRVGGTVLAASLGEPS